MNRKSLRYVLAFAVCIGLVAATKGDVTSIPMLQITHDSTTEPALEFTAAGTAIAEAANHLVVQNGLAGDMDFLVGQKLTMLANWTQYGAGTPTHTTNIFMNYLDEGADQRGAVIINADSNATGDLGEASIDINPVGNRNDVIITLGAVRTQP